MTEGELEAYDFETRQAVLDEEQQYRYKYPHNLIVRIDPEPSWGPSHIEDLEAHKPLTPFPPLPWEIPNFKPTIRVARLVLLGGGQIKITWQDYPWRMQLDITAHHTDDRIIAFMGR